MIDGHIRAPWPDDVSAALELFAQGYVIERPPVLFWTHPTTALHALGHRDVTEDDPLPDDGEEAVAAASSCPEFGILLTQTCDIRDARSPKKPFVHVSPVVRTQRHENEVRSGKITYLHYVPKIPEPGVWVADLRLQVPIDKGWLCLRASNTFDGFASDDDRRSFAECIARQADRPAIADAVVDHLLRPLRKELETTAKRGDRVALLDPFDEIGLNLSGDRLAPDAVEMVLLYSGEPPPPATTKWFEEWWAENVTKTLAGQMTVVSPRIADLKEMSAAEYRRLQILDLGHLTPE